MYTQDDIYGISLEEYAKVHNKSVDDIIKSVEIDISILYDRLHSLDIMDAVFDIVYKAKSKKQKHLDRLLEWKMLNVKTD